MRSKSVLSNHKILNAVGKDSYNEVNWTFLNNNSTHYKSVFGKQREKYKNELLKPKFDTRMKTYGSASP